MMEKLAFALITASRKLRNHFQTHVINVLTDHPLKKVMNKLEAAERLIQWAIELGEFDIRYQPRSVINAQALVDFIAKFTPNHGDLEKVEEDWRWVIYVDGSSTLYARGIGVILNSQNGTSLNMQLVYSTKQPTTKLNMKPSLKGWNWLSP